MHNHRTIEYRICEDSYEDVSGDITVYMLKEVVYGEDGNIECIKPICLEDWYDYPKQLEDDVIRLIAALKKPHINKETYDKFASVHCDDTW